MKTAVIYNSQTGFTRQYARWIAEAAGADCFALESAKKRDFAEYDAVVFGSWACAGRVHKIAWFKRRMAQWTGKRLIVFCTGGSPAENPEIEDFWRGSLTEAERERVSVFYCPGGFRYECLPAGARWMMKLFRRAAGAKREKTEAEAEMLRMISHSYDLTDRKYAEPILALLRGEGAGR